MFVDGSEIRLITWEIVIKNPGNKKVDKVPTSRGAAFLRPFFFDAHFSSNQLKLPFYTPSGFGVDFLGCLKDRALEKIWNTRATSVFCSTVECFEKSSF